MSQLDVQGQADTKSFWLQQIVQIIIIDWVESTSVCNPIE